MGILARIAKRIIVGKVHHTPHVKPRIISSTVDECGDRSTVIEASNYLDAASFRDGTTIEGDSYKTLTKIGKNKWRAGSAPIDYTTPK